ncbi:hypothetical protein KKF84_05900, partial [Myxococcota bacterium]|nr:hypothetical protein [Myxococcota bacterium]
MTPLTLFSGCISQRTYSTPVHKHLFYEVEIKNDVTRRIRVHSKTIGTTVTLRFSEEKFCRNVEYDVEKLSITKTYQAPNAKYFMGIGGLLMALSLPSYYMGFFRSEGSASAVHIGIGSGLFFLPGLALSAYSFYRLSQERSETQAIGQVRRVIKSREYPCGVLVLKGEHKVEILTKSGPHVVGVIHGTGTATFDIKMAKPLYSESRQDFYYEVFVDKESVGLIYPFTSRTSGAKSTEM